jgi:hypothetical protein
LILSALLVEASCGPPWSAAIWRRKMAGGGRAKETLTFTVEDGKITRIESSFSPEDEAAEDGFWA